MDAKVILEHIISVKALDEYRSLDSCLDSLIVSLAKSFNEWQSLKNIYVSNQTVRASKIEPIFQRRLLSIPDEKHFSDHDEQIQTKQLKNSTTQFVNYLKLHPDAEITFATFNCDKYSYDVQCGILDQKLDVICVIKGKPIPEELLAR
jgi:hypothetical protein